MEYTLGKKDKKSFFAGFIMGGLAGAGTMLLFAPQSGKNTRTQIQEKSFELREQTTQAVGNAVDLVKTKSNEIVDTV